MKFKEHLKHLNESKITLYHGDNHGTRFINPKRMMTDNSNNQEGVGIYFSPDIEVAKSYGKFIVSCEVNPDSFVEARKTVRQTRKIKNKLSKMFKAFHKIDPEGIWYMMTDYGIDLSEPEDIKSYHFDDLVQLMLDEEIRNLQITLVEYYDVETFVKVWNSIYTDITGTYNKELDFYAITKKVKLTQIPNKGNQYGV